VDKNRAKHEGAIHADIVPGQYAHHRSALQEKIPFARDTDFLGTYMCAFALRPIGLPINPIC